MYAHVHPAHLDHTVGTKARVWSLARASAESLLASGSVAGGHARGGGGERLRRYMALLRQPVRTAEGAARPHAAPAPRSGVRE